MRLRAVPRRIVAAAAAVALLVPLACSSSSHPKAAAGFRPPPIEHVWVIQLENQGYSSTFDDPSADPYLAKTLPAQGALLTQYHAIGHVSNDNYIAQVSGQAPNPQTQADCGTFTNFQPTGVAGIDGQVPGKGCVFPSSVSTIGNQLSATGRSWKAYEQDMGNDPTRDMTDATRSGPACGHPALDQPDHTEVATAADQYATRHDPSVYFHSIIDNRAYCDAHVVSFQPLAADLATVATTPSFSYLTPNLCNDGHDPHCANGQSGGLGRVDTFLSKVVPMITASPAYRAGGMIVITFDEADTSDSSACCGETTTDTASHPNAPQPGLNGPGGGRIGAVVLSPFVRAGTVSATPYNHYSLLRSVEDLFGLSHLGDAGQPGVTSFGPDVYTRPPAARS